MIRYEQSNGVVVLLQDCPGKVASLYWWVNHGSTSERPGEEGFAHFLEHMLFKDSAAKDNGRPSTGALAKSIESLGGDINAYTSFDQTVFHVTCPDIHFDAIFAKFLTITHPQRFLKEDFEREREVILEELRKTLDSPDRAFYQEVFALSYGKHPYGRPVIGYEKTLRSAKLSQLEAFYKRNYTSAAFGFIIAAPQMAERRPKIAALLELSIGSKKYPKTRAKVLDGARTVMTVPVPKASVRRTAVQAFDVKACQCMISFRVPDLNHPDMPALDLLANILGMGESGRGYQKLFYETSLVTDFSAGVYAPLGPGIFTIQFDFDDVKLISNILKNVSLLIKDLRKNGMQPEEQLRVVNNLMSDRSYGMQTVDGVASRLGFFEFTVHNHRFDSEVLEVTRNLTSADLNQVIDKYLRDDQVSLVLQVPKGTKVPKNWHDEFRLPESPAQKGNLVAQDSQRKKAKRPEVERIDLSSGLQLVINHRAFSPVIAVQASVRAGTLAEDGIFLGADGHVPAYGLCNFLAQTWSKGTDELNSRQVAEACEGHASSIEGFSGRNTLGMSMTTLKRFWPQMSPLFARLLWNPEFAPIEVEHTRRLAIDHLKSMDESSAQVAMRLFYDQLFEGHAYARSVYGDLETIQKISSQDCKKAFRNWVRLPDLVLSISGALDREEVIDWATRIEELANQYQLQDPARLALKQSGPLQLLKAPRWASRSFGREQTHVVIGGRGVDLFSKDRYVLRMIQTILGGQSGRLFIELREKRSMAYSISPISFEGIGLGALGTYIACAPEKVSDAKLEIRKVYERLAAKGPTSTELKRAKQLYLGQKSMELQTESSLASHYGLQQLYGLKEETDEELAKILNAISASTIQRLVEKYYLDQPMVDVTVS